MGMKKRGLTLVEIMMAISVISIGIFPLLAALSGMVEKLLIQKDMMSSLTVGTMQMDAYLMGFQTVDQFLPEGAQIYPPEIPVVGPGVRSRYLADPASDTLDLFYNNSYFRTFTRFIKEEDLSGPQWVTYRLEMQVWKIGVPVASTATEDIVPEWKNGDEMLFELSALYAQANTLNAQ